MLSLAKVAVVLGATAWRIDALKSGKPALALGSNTDEVDDIADAVDEDVDEESLEYGSWQVNYEKTPLRRHGSDAPMEELCSNQGRIDAIRGFQKHFEGKWSSRIHEAFGNVTTKAMLTIGDWHSNPMLRNFMAFADIVSTADKTPLVVVNAALDTSGHDACLGLRSDGIVKGAHLEVRCVDLAGWLPDECFVDDRKNGTNGFGSCAYSFIVWTKPVILLAAVEASEKGVLMMDTDVVLYQNLLNYTDTNFGQKKYGIFAVGLDGPRAIGHPNTGSVFVTKNVLPEMHTWVALEENYINESYVDQSPFRPMLWNKTFREDMIEWFPRAVVGQCGGKGEWATHYTCTISKPSHMARRGDWYQTKLALAKMHRRGDLKVIYSHDGRGQRLKQ